MKLTEYLQKDGNLSAETSQLINNLCEYRELPKGYQLLREGSRSKKVYFVEKGLLRLYYIKDGKDISHAFFAEKKMYIPIENVFLHQPYPYCLVSLEDSVIRSVDFSKIEDHLDEDIKLQRFVRYLMTNTIKTLALHLYSIQFQSAQERYSLLLKSHPDILLRVPLGHIASYLGITQQTLSVIRAERSK